MKSDDDFVNDNINSAHSYQSLNENLTILIIKNLDKESMTVHHLHEKGFGITRPDVGTRRRKSMT